MELTSQMLTKEMDNMYAMYQRMQPELSGDEIFMKMMPRVLKFVLATGAQFPEALSFQGQGMSAPANIALPGYVNPTSVPMPLQNALQQPTEHIPPAAPWAGLHQPQFTGQPAFSGQPTFFGSGADVRPRPTRPRPYEYGAGGYQPQIGAYGLGRRSPLEDALRRLQGGM